MPEATRDDTARVRLQGKRVALGIVLVLSVAIIGSSSLQIIGAVFGAGIHRIPASARGTPAQVCAEGVLRLARALDRSAEAAGSASFQASLRPEWNEAGAIQQACSQSSEGLDAWASLARLRSAEEQLASGVRTERQAELAPLRDDVSAHLPADLR
jgi:hypothetical protein